jgi:hypothetical protein
MLIGMSTCDCCDKEHPNAIHTYPIIDSNVMVEKFWNDPQVASVLAYIIVVVLIISVLLTLFSIFYAIVYICTLMLLIVEKFR